MKILLGITGASGSIYAKRFLDIVSGKKLDLNIELIFTKNGEKVWQYELKQDPKSLPYYIYNNENLFSAPASGSSRFDKMIIMPCSMATLGKIANGISNNLLTRAADVMLKEKRTLILVPRETPLNLIHIKNMEKLLLAGATIIPANPSFYSFPEDINALIDTVLDKVFSSLAVNIRLISWK